MSAETEGEIDLMKALTSSLRERAEAPEEREACATTMGTCKCSNAVVAGPCGDVDCDWKPDCPPRSETDGGLLGALERGALALGVSSRLKDRDAVDLLRELREHLEAWRDGDRPRHDALLAYLSEAVR